MNDVCPHCGAALQPEAQFCPHCMAILSPKTELPAPKPPKRKKLRLIAWIAAAAVLLCTGAGLFVKQQMKRHTPLCSFAQFSATAKKASTQMVIDTLWDVNGFTDTHYNQKEDVRYYTTDTNLGDALFWLFFYHEGEEVYSYCCDITPDRLADAERLLKCVVQCVCNHYITDIDAVFDDETRYPKTTLDEPFEPSFTDLIDRTERYNAAIAAGTSISTRYIPMATENEEVIFAVVERKTGDTVLYDLSVEIRRATL